MSRGRIVAFNRVPAPLRPAFGAPIEIRRTFVGGAIWDMLAQPAAGPKLSFGQLTLIRRGIAFSAFGSTSVITPSLSSALIPSCSILLEI